MRDLPEDVASLVRSREEARARRDYGAADAIRTRLRDMGYEVVDTPSGPEIGPRAAPTDRVEPLRRSDQVESLLEGPTAFDASIQWVVEGWPGDVVRGIESFRAHHPGRSLQHVVVDLAGTDPGMWPPGIDLVHVAPEAGWAAGRNAGLRRAAASVVLLADGSIEARGDVLSPLAAALADRDVGLTGPFGIVTEDLREFRESTGPDVDAVEAYLMALRRDLVVDGLRFDEGFRFYRTADIDFSFRVKAGGLRVTVTDVPVERHVHRIWATTPEEVRTRLSKRNFYRFLDRWRGRTDLLASR